jgi:hypothetical protein
MRICRVIAVTVLLLGLSVTAHADILATGALYGTTSQDNILCYLFNAGTGLVTVTSNQIIRESGTNLSLAADNCGTMAPGSTCRIFVSGIVNNLAHSCRFVLSPSAADVRGFMEVRSGLTVLVTSELR